MNGIVLEGDQECLLCMLLSYVGRMEFIQKRMPAVRRYLKLNHVRSD